MVSILLSGCGNEKNPISAGTYTMQQTPGKAFAPAVTLNLHDNSFSFTYDPLLSYFPNGTFTVSDGKVRAVTDDGKFTYLFEIVDNTTLRFVQNGSAQTITASGELAVHDGATFKFMENANEK